MSFFVAWACTLAMSSEPLGGICYTDPATYSHARDIHGCAQTAQDMAAETNGWRLWVDYKCVQVTVGETGASGKTK